MKNKKIILFVIIITLIILLPIISFFVFKKSKTESVNPLAESSALSKIAEEEKLLSYQDTAGFKFNYPQSVTVKDVSNNDPNTYSLLELGSAKNDGKMLIKVVDSNLDSVDQWLKSKEATGAGNSREVIISQMPGKQIQFENPSRLVSLAISDGIMYFFQSSLDSAGFWNKVHSQIISSFSQNGTTEKTVEENKSGADFGEETVSENEEVIE